MQKRKLLMAYAIVMLLLICLGMAYIISMEHDAPEIVVPPLPACLTADHEIDALLFDPGSGIKSVEVTLELGGKIFPLISEEFAERQNSRHVRFKLLPPSEAAAARENTGNLEGTLHIKATDYSTIHWWRGNSSRFSAPFRLDLDPPQAEITGLSRQIRQGGSAALSFRASEPLQSAILRIGPAEFKAFKQKNLAYACVFAFPLGLEAAQFKPELVLTDPAGHVSSIPLDIEAVQRDYGEDNINLGPSFINGKFSEFSMSAPGEEDPLQLFLRMNGEVRAQNYRELAEAKKLTAQAPLWREGFMKLPRSVKRGLFGDRRVYIYDGKIIDRQTHNGIDFASYSRDRIPAASSGVVLMARYLGIHGNMALLDHGLGVQSLYSHMSVVNVAPGQEVERGQLVGLTGTSGMAGGDHLHFEIFVGGYPVEPDEWLSRAWCEQLDKIISASASEVPHNP